MKINKIIILTAIMTICMGGYAFGAENKAVTTTAQAITYNTATQMAIRTSSDLKRTNVSYEKAEESDSNLNYGLGEYNAQLIQLDKQYGIQYKWAEKQVALSKDQISNDIINSIDNLWLLEKNKKLSEEKVKLQTQQYLSASVKFDNGLISKVELASEKQKKEIEIQNLAALEKDIDAAYLKINSTLGLKSTDRPTFEILIEYAELEGFNVDRHISTSMSKDPYLWYAEQNVELADLKLITYEHNDSSYYNGQSSYKLTALDVRTAKINQSESKKKYSDQINTNYNSLLKLETNREVQLLNLEQSKLNLNSVKAQYDLGLSTKSKLQEAEYSVAQIEYQIKNIELEHEQLKKVLLSPYLNPQYMTS